MSDLEQVLVFLTSLESVDADRLCVLGSGWGGWLVLAALLANTPGLGQVRCGLARAPLTDWRLGRRTVVYQIPELGHLLTSNFYCKLTKDDFQFRNLFPRDILVASGMTLTLGWVTTPGVS